MEAQEDYHQVNKQTMIKGKRTKRHRAQSQPVSSLALSIAAPSSSSSTGGDGGGGGGELLLLDSVSTSSSADLFGETMSRATEEEEDMANCLILLAQGRDRHDHLDDRPARHVSYGVYQCKTCDRCFPSFQALGGHRASHKKPKGNNSIGEEKKTTSFLVVDHDLHEQFVNSATSTTLSLQIASRGILGNRNNVNSNNISSNNSNKPKVHECSICGAEFTSGQALGGHMRRHRTTSFMTAPTATTMLSVGTTSTSDRRSEESKKPRNVLQLDLNLPAPDDDRREAKFPFAGKEQVIVFTASPLVDCHY